MNEFIDLAAKSEAAREKAQREEAQRQEEVVQAELAKQVEDGRCNIVPLPNVATRPFRAELYTESMPLFVSNSYKGESRVYERELKHPQTSEPILDRIIVGKAARRDKERGVLKQEHQECWYKLLKLWDEQGYALETDKATMGVLKMSQYKLVMALIGDDSAKAYGRANRLLADLSGIPIQRSQTYLWQGKSDKVSFKLVDGVTWVAENVDTKTMLPRPGGRAEVTVSFSAFVTEQFLRKRVKQLLLTPYLELSATDRELSAHTKAASQGPARPRGGRRSALAPLLYAKLDHELASKDRYHIRLETLLSELGMATYRYKSKRKEKVDPSLERLNGKPIVGEKYTLCVSLREATNGKDFILEAERSAPQMRLPGVE